MDRPRPIQTASAGSRPGADPEVPLRFATGACSLGAFLVAWSPRGIRSIDLDDDADALRRDLLDRLPHAEASDDGDPGPTRRIERVERLLEARGPFDEPLDVRGTDFQRRVWRALGEIPAGRTVPYAELAARLGAPRSVRAVAGACGANALAVAVPCHRVVRSDGGLGGYRWGVERKRTLLRRERAWASRPAGDAPDGERPA